MINVHSLGRSAAVFEEAVVLALGPVLADGSGGGSNVAGPSVVLWDGNGQ